MADCLRALDVLKDRPEADVSRLAVVGNDLAAITAALRPNVSYLLINALLFRGTSGRISELTGYPGQEFADYVRSYPEHADQVAETLAMFDPIAFAQRIQAESLIQLYRGSAAVGRAAGRCRGWQSRAQGKHRPGYPDHGYEESWLTERTSASPTRMPE